MAVFCRGKTNSRSSDVATSSSTAVVVVGMRTLIVIVLAKAVVA